MDTLPTQAYWDGDWKCGSGGTDNPTFEVVNPSTTEVIANVIDCNMQDAKDAIEAASEAFKTWSLLSVREREDFLLKIRDQLLERKEELAKIMTMENGKPKTEAMREIGSTAAFLEFFAAESRLLYEAETPTNFPKTRMIACKQPAGVVAIISPWNFPLGVMGRKISAALAAGCTCVIKPAEATPLTALYFAKICHDTELPKGVVNFIPCSRNRVEEIGKILCESRIVEVLSFTGSSRVAKKLYSQCGDTLKRLSLEMGGCSAFTVFSSADLNVAVNGTIAKKFWSYGQNCKAANRIFVHASINDEFVSRLAVAMEAQIKIGSGFSATVNLGPVINYNRLQKISAMVDQSIAKGAILVKGTDAPKGLFYPPSLLTNVTDDMPVFWEDSFAPVAAIVTFETEEELLALASDSEPGLAGYFYSNSMPEIWRVAKALKVGMVAVNDTAVSTWETQMSSTGAVKYSGYARERSRFGLEEFTYSKYIYFETP